MENKNGELELTTCECSEKIIIGINGKKGTYRNDIGEAIIKAVKGMTGMTGKIVDSKVSMDKSMITIAKVTAEFPIGIDEETKETIYKKYKGISEGNVYSSIAQAYINAYNQFIEKN